MSKWEQFEKWIREQNFPQNIEKFKDPAWLEEWVKSIVGMSTSYMRDGGDPKENSHIQIREGKEQIEVKYTLPDATDINQIRLFVKEDCIKIDGLPNQQVEKIKLPKLVKAKYCRATLIDKQLVIRMSKRQISEKYYSHQIII